MCLERCPRNETSLQCDFQTAQNSGPLHSPHDKLGRRRVNALSSGASRHPDDSDSLDQEPAATVCHWWCLCHPVRTIAIIALVLSYTIALASEREYLRIHPQPSWSSIEQMHAVYVEKFIQSSGFGVGRMGPSDLRDRFELVLNGQPHVVKKVELIGLVKHPEPTAYVTFSIPPQKAFFTNSSARFDKTRALTIFETDALVDLRNGRNDVLGTHDGSAAILGAVRAQEKCLKCHDGKAGNLLGAFSYSMALVGKPAVPNLTNNPTPTTLASQFGSQRSSSAPAPSAATNLATRITNASPHLTHHAPRTTNRLSNPF